MSASTSISRYSFNDPRTQRIISSISGSFIVKGLSALTSLLLVKVMLIYLDEIHYGTWLTISSLVSFIGFFDIGIGQGLRNKFAEAVAQNNLLLARTYLSTAYGVFGIITACLLLLFFIINPYLSWQKILNSNLPETQLSFIASWLITGFCAKLVLDLLIYVLLAIQRPALAGSIFLSVNLLTLLGIWGLSSISKGNLIYVAQLSTICPLIVVILFSIVLYNTKLTYARPSFKAIDFKYSRDLLKIGYQFFLIQIAVLILYYTDNLIISHLFGPSQVTVYNVVYRYFSLVTIAFGVISSPFWSAFTEANTLKDKLWIQKAQQGLRLAWLIMCGLTVMLAILSPWVFSIWLGDQIHIPFFLVLCMAMYVIIYCWSVTSASILNGLGKLRIQLIVALIGAIINIPLCILFGQYWQWGSTGVIVATSVSILVGTVFMSHQAQLIISGRAKGIWDK